MKRRILVGAAVVMISSGLILWLLLRPAAPKVAPTSVTYRSGQLQEPGTIILQDAGTGKKVTKPFAVNQRWNVDYTFGCSSDTSQQSFDMTVLQNNKPVTDLPSIHVAGHDGFGQLPLPRKGTFSLVIDTQCQWEVKVSLPTK
jgi:hypothetical protein